jgi:hypothetical protein
MTPLKGNDYYILYVANPGEKNQYRNEDKTEDYIEKVQKGMKEICPTCKNIFNKMFELRLHRLGELADEINLMYNLPTRKKLKEKRNGKEKK